MWLVTCGVLLYRRVGCPARSVRGWAAAGMARVVGGGGGYLLWWGRASGASPSELCRECADAPDAELP